MRTESLRETSASGEILPMRLLLASSDVHPYSKSGGLADMVAAMGPKTQRPVRFLDAAHVTTIADTLHHVEGAPASSPAPATA